MKSEGLGPNQSSVAVLALIGSRCDGEPADKVSEYITYSAERPANTDANDEIRDFKK